VGLAAIHHQPRCAISLAGLGENVFPLHLGTTEHARNESTDLVVRRAGAALRLRAPLIGRLVGPLVAGTAAAGQNLGTADQHPRIDAERPAGEREQRERADPEPAAADRHAEAAATAGKTALTAAVLNIAALFQVFPAHRSAPSPI